MKKKIEAFSTEDILQIKNGKWIWKGRPLNSEAISKLKEEAGAFHTTVLWQVLTSGIKWNGVKTLLEQGETAEDLRFAKLLGHIVDTMDNLLFTIKNS